jgi:non-canonical (house-cleaning) NTP pyrophosphatase
VLAQEVLHNSEVTQHVKEAMEESDVVFLILGHPEMRSDVGFVDLLSSFLVFFPSRPFDPII